MENFIKVNISHLLVLSGLA